MLGYVMPGQNKLGNVKPD